MDTSRVNRARDLFVSEAVGERSVAKRGKTVVAEMSSSFGPFLVAHILPTRAKSDRKREAVGER